MKNIIKMEKIRSAYDYIIFVLKVEREEVINFTRFVILVINIFIISVVILIVRFISKSLLM